MSDATIADNKPVKITLDKDKKYYFCMCGLSSKQPFCDGSHKGSEFTPVKVEIEEKKTVWLCGCKRTDRKPYCDGTHNKL